MIQDFDLEKATEPLLQWFSGHARTLPWRENISPYRVWVSEIMLQQTRVEAVKPYFKRFMEQLPDIESLANCDEDTLLKLWEGLGYYNRVRNMQLAARQVMEEYDGVMPSDYESLLKLKGIGSYTAGAISSIAYGKAEPAVDGNVFRVLTRLTLDSHDILKQSFRKIVEQTLREYMPQKEAANYNQALMELGATVCVPNGEPKCEECPWEQICLAHQVGREMDFPVKAKAKARKIQEKTVLLVVDGEQCMLQKRPNKGLLAGMYEFPSLDHYAEEKEVIKQVKDMGCAPLYIEKLEAAKHIFSHVEWHMIAYLIKVEELEKVKKPYLLVDRERAEADYAIPAAYGAYTKYMQIRLGNEKFEDSN